jgi:hypothetical protein
MMPLNKLEEGILWEICRRAPTGTTPALEAQLKVVTVLRRQNTGAGFFTDLSTDHALAPIDGARVIGSVWAKVGEFKQPMIFLIFLRDGFIHMLEGATTDDSTVDIDFSKLEFEVLPPIEYNRSNSPFKK